MRLNSKYKALCRDNNDPKMRGRIRVEAPVPLGRGPLNWSTWAEPCFPANHFHIPEEGDGVWIEFEAGDPARPIWTGIWYKGAGAASDAPFQAVHGVLTDWDGAEADPDKTDHTDPGSIDNAEHKEYHDHQAGEFYTPHRFGTVSHTGHSLEFNDHPGRQGAVTLSDRFGRSVEFLSRGITRLQGLILTKASTLWKDIEGTDVDGAHTLIMADSRNDVFEGEAAEHGSDPELPGYVHQATTATKPIEAAKLYTLLRGMAYGFLRMVSDPGKEHTMLGDFWGQYLRINSVSGSEYVELFDKAGQTVRLDVPQGTVTVAQEESGQSLVMDGPNGRITVTDAEGNTLVIENGKIALTAAVGDITLNVPTGSNVNVGGETGEELVTKTHLQQTFNLHTHPTATGPSGPPIQQAPMVPGSDITEKQLSE